MKAWLLEYLRCPLCAGMLAVESEQEAVEDDLRYGIVACRRCKESYPVVESILLLAPSDTRLDAKGETEDVVIIPGPMLRDVIQAVRGSDLTFAFSLLLSPTSLNGRGWTFDPAHPASSDRLETRGSSAGSEPSQGLPQIKRSLLEKFKGPYRACRRHYRRLQLPTWRRRLAEYLRGHAHTLSASDLIATFYGDYSGSEMASYFCYRFGQPRHLAALAAAYTLRQDDGLVLDLACGAGHLTHYLSYGLPTTRTIGIDREFFRLYLAQHYLAPNASFVCMHADVSLPFADGALNGVLCSDAFHYFRRKAAAAREIDRTLSDKGIAVLTRVGNRLRTPNEGYELEPMGYQKLFSDASLRVLGEQALIADYLQRRAPDLSTPLTEPDEKWLTLFISRDDSFFRNHGTFESWPHGVGRLIINPLFVESSKGSHGSKELRFQFPSAWYAYEDAAYRSYTRDSTSVSADVMADLANGHRSAALVEHIERFEVIGAPDRFTRPLET